MWKLLRESVRSRPPAIRFLHCWEQTPVRSFLEARLLFFFPCLKLVLLLNAVKCFDSASSAGRFLDTMLLKCSRRHAFVSCLGTLPAPAIIEGSLFVKFLFSNPRKYESDFSPGSTPLNTAPCYQSFDRGNCWPIALDFIEDISDCTRCWILLRFCYLPL